ncbi:MAG TPA: glycosyltransferase family A protein, partial [Candidatus Krumholzibacteria bacterium]|nr:glycosyltransferase family A protein [Candidatus Krumholzibacteria bacterium]
MNVGTAPLRIHLGEPDALPRVTLLSPCGASSRSRHHDDAPVRGSCLEALVLEGPRLQHVEESARRSVLRRARRLLRPGGTLTVPVGPEHDQYPREALQDAAWSCGFDAYIRYVAGSAVLTRPRREAPAQPLVSVLIPAYKPAFLAQALASAMAQTWPRLEIVVGDDSPDGTIAQLVAAARPSLRPGHELRSIRNEGTIGGRANYLNLFAEARGAYVKYLNDDDLLAPDCVAVMADVLMRHPDVTLVTSYRQLIDDAGAPLPDRDFNRPLADHDTVIDGRTLATKILSERTNLVGEPTTVMFRK